MSCIIPIFDFLGQQHRADDCRPLVEAADAGRVRLSACVHGHYPGQKLPRNMLRGLKSVGYWDANHDQNWGLDWHRNEGIELTFLETGGLDFGVEDGAERLSYLLRPNHLTITRPWQQHRIGSPNVTAGRLHWLILDVGVRRPDQTWRWPPWIVLTKQDLDELTHMLRHNEQPVWQGNDEMLECFKRIGAIVEQQDTQKCVSKLTVLINELLLLLLERLRSQEMVLDESLSDTRRSVAMFLDDLSRNINMLGYDWSVRELADSCGLGETRFIHYCRQLKNMTPAKFLNNCRLNAAAKLLVERPEMSITQTALVCGFSSSQYFATAFQRHHGISPSDYRKSLDGESSTGELPRAREMRKVANR
jgi:AraC-like DNA-binding protein